MLPDEPVLSVLPGKRNWPQSNVTSSFRRPNHQEPVIMIGYLPAMKATPMSSATMPATSLAM